MVIHVSELSNPILVGIREGLHIIYLIMSVVWFLKKVFRTGESSKVLPIIRTLWFDQRDLMTCGSISAVL
jgi:hypothetical protein